MQLNLDQFCSAANNLHAGCTSHIAVLTPQYQLMCKWMNLVFFVISLGANVQTAAPEHGTATRTHKTSTTFTTNYLAWRHFRYTTYPERKTAAARNRRARQSFPISPVAHELTQGGPAAFPNVQE